jgi:hypothetical protein
MCYFLNIASQLERIFKSKNLENRKIEKSINLKIIDVYDGTLYQDVIGSNPRLADLFYNNKASSMLLNTDGISVSESSNLSIWPILLVINEIEPERRFCFENIVIASNFFLNSKILNNFKNKLK